MKEVFTSIDATEVQLRKAMLDEEGIPSFVRNEALSQLANALVGSFQASLCVMNNEDYERALTVLRALKSTAEGPDWICPQCNESVPASFDSCWNCETLKPAS
jgi:hypothetical protein